MTKEIKEHVDEIFEGAMEISEVRTGFDIKCPKLQGRPVVVFYPEASEFTKGLHVVKQEDFWVGEDGDMAIGHAYYYSCNGSKQIEAAIKNHIRKQYALDDERPEILSISCTVCGGCNPEADE